MGLAPPAVGGVVEHLQLSGLGIRPVGGGEPVQLLRGHREPGVGHSQRIEDALPQHRLQIAAAGPRQQHAQHLGGRVVEPPLARLVHERQRPERRHPPVRIVGDGRPGRPADAVQAQRCLGPLDRIAAGRRHHRSEAEPEAEQILDRDRPMGGHGVVELGVDRAQHAAVGELRQQLVDRLLQPQQALVDQRQRRRRGDRLGQRGDPEDRVALQRRVVAERRRADGVDVQLVAVGDERDQSR